jgi:hypothetical protein
MTGIRPWMGRIKSLASVVEAALFLDGRDSYYSIRGGWV